MLAMWLYAGDDTLEGLRTQLSVLTAMEQGWRPTRPCLRGAAPPLSEPALLVELSGVDMTSRFKHLLP